MLVFRKERKEVGSSCGRVRWPREEIAGLLSPLLLDMRNAPCLAPSVLCPRGSCTGHATPSPREPARVAAKSHALRAKGLKENGPVASGKVTAQRTLGRGRWRTGWDLAW